MTLYLIVSRTKLAFRLSHWKLDYEKTEYMNKVKKQTFKRNQLWTQSASSSRFRKLKSNYLARSNDRLMNE
jgi:hypothetical protein